MNNARRIVLRELFEQIESVQCTLENIADIIESVMDDEQEAYDNLPESLQESERGEHMSECINALYDIVWSLRDVIDLDGIEYMIDEM